MGRYHNGAIFQNGFLHGNSKDGIHFFSKADLGLIPNHLKKTPLLDLWEAFGGNHYCLRKRKSSGLTFNREGLPAKAQIHFPFLKSVRVVC